MHRKLIISVLIFVLLTAFGALALATSKADLAQLRAQAKELVDKQGEMGWGSWVLGNPSDQASLYNEYPALFTKESIATVGKALAGEKDKQKRKALVFFKNYLEAEYLYKQSALLWDIYSDLESQLQILVDGKLVPYRDLHGLLGNAKTPEERAELAKEEYRIYGLLNDVILKRELAMSHRVVKELGYDHYLDLAVQYKNIDLDSLLARCEDFLAKSETTYLQLFDAVSPIPRENFRRSDILFVLGAKDWDGSFNKVSLVPAMEKTLMGMGIDVAGQKNLLMHTEALPKKNPRAVCFAIGVPDDVRISIKPSGGKQDYSALFHEMGHAEHFANTKTDVWEFQQLGSNAVTEGYAYLFEGLIENRLWLEQFSNMKPAAIDKYLEHAKFTNLYMMRRYMSKLIYEVKLHQGEAEPKKLYQDLMSKGYGFALNDDEATRYLSDVDPLLYSADYVQAFFLQAMLEATLHANYGAKWWTNEKAGEFLKSLFAKGNELSGKELAKLLGYDDLSSKQLAAKYL